MGCQDTVEIGDNLVFSITSHDADTAVLTDADNPPPYRIYEDEIDVPILIGVMEARDAVNTTGFYTELIACTVANGFQDGRTYTIYIACPVDSDTGGICFGFRATLPLSTLIGTATITVSGPVVAGGNVTTYQSDSYQSADGREISWSSTGWPDLTGGTIAVIVDEVASFAGAVVTPVGTAVVQVELTAVQTLTITKGKNDFQVVATVGGDTFTLVDAYWTSKERASA